VAPSPAALLRLAESIADGAPIDWDATEANSPPEQRAVVRQLHVLADLAVLHRSLPSDAAETAPGPRLGSTATGSAIGVWGHLSLMERLGRGTFGEVFRAWDRTLEREVALKLLLPGKSPEDPETSRIAVEGRHMARVHHTNVITVHGVAVHDGRVGLWMELIRGATLSNLLGSRGPFSAREAALVGIDLCRALAAIHAAGLVHRDVKAQNVMREDGGRIVLMDLGVGREIAANQPHDGTSIAGTPLYLAPEIFTGAPAGVSTDVYSLGVLLYHLVTNSYPVRGTTMTELREEHAKGRRVRLRDRRADLPTAFVRVVDRAIGSQAERYSTPGELEADLLQSLDEVAVPQRTASAHAEGGSRRSAPWSVWALAAGLTILVVSALVWLGLRNGQPSAVSARDVRSIAVLPLANLSGDPSQDYFADGLTDELISTLGRIADLKVISRTSVAQFKGTTRSVPDIARRLNVDAILEGSVRIVPSAATPASQDPPRVRISARLILAGTDTQLWNRTFERVRADALGLQSEVAQAVAEEINRQLAPSTRGAQVTPSRGSGDSQAAYLEGRSYLVNVDREGMVKARQALERAVQLDPNFARAHATLSVCYVFLELTGVLSRADAYTLAERGARRALELDGNLPEAHSALADLQLLYDWNWSAAGDSYRRALALNPSYTFARRQYAWYLAALGRGAESLQQAKLAESADPLSPDALSVVAMMLYFNREYDEAILQMERSVALGGARAQEHNGLARALSAKQSYPEAIREIEEAIRLSSGTPAYVAELARIYASAGNLTAARETFSKLEQTAKTSNAHISPLAYVFLHAALGDKEAAFRRLDEAIRDRVPLALWAKVDPRFDPLRGDPRFSEALKRLGLPADR
jgi:serine/threonine protein kinase/tetratricopeptide (TPR) repeat protein